MHTVELLLDPRLEDRVRQDWARLRDAGLPSLATHPHPTNRPHLTVLSAESLAGLPSLPLPTPAELAPARMLGRALVRPVTATAGLRRIHAEAWAALAGFDAWPPPADWIPHVSLALRVPVEQRDAAIHVLGGLPLARGHFTAARSYDSRTRTAGALRAHLGQ